MSLWEKNVNKTGLAHALVEYTEVWEKDQKKKNQTKIVQSVMSALKGAEHWSQILTEEGSY